MLASRAEDHPLSVVHNCLLRITSYCFLYCKYASNKQQGHRTNNEVGTRDNIQIILCHAGKPVF